MCSNPYVLWEESMTDPAEKVRAAEIREILADDERFVVLKELVAFLSPVYKLLRMVDGYTPAVGKIYYKSVRIDTEMGSTAEQAGEDSWQAD
jgi:hypothetical protein